MHLNSLKFTYVHKQIPPFIFMTYKSRAQSIIMRPSSSLTFDTFPVVAAVTTSRRELVEIVLRLPYVDRLVLRTADDVLAVVTTEVNRDLLTLYRRSIQSKVKQMTNCSRRKSELTKPNSAVFPLTLTSGYWSNDDLFTYNMWHKSRKKSQRVRKVSLVSGYSSTSCAFNHQTKCSIM